MLHELPRRSLLIILLVCLVIFAVVNFIAARYDPYSDALAMGSELNPMVRDLGLNNPMMQYAASELYAMVQTLTAGTARLQNIPDDLPEIAMGSQITCLFAFVLLSQLWAFMEGVIFQPEFSRSDDFVSRLLIFAIHYMASFTIMYLMGLISMEVGDFIEGLTIPQPGGSPVPVLIGMLLTIVIILISIPCYFGFVINWMGYCIPVFCILKLTDAIMPLDEIFATTPEMLIHRPGVLILLGIVLAFDRFWVDHVKDKCYNLPLTLLIALGSR